MKNCEDCGYEWDEDAINWRFDSPDSYMITCRSLEVQFVTKIIKDAEKRKLTTINIDVWMPTMVPCNTCALRNHRALLDSEALARTYKEATGTYIYFPF